MCLVCNLHNFLIPFSCTSPAIPQKVHVIKCQTHHSHPVSPKQSCQNNLVKISIQISISISIKSHDHCHTHQPLRIPQYLCIWMLRKKMMTDLCTYSSFLMWSSIIVCCWCCVVVCWTELTDVIHRSSWYSFRNCWIIIQRYDTFIFYWKLYNITMMRLSGCGR